MRVDETGIPGTYRVLPERLSDERGHFYEAARYSVLTERTGLPFSVRQVNNSVSREGVLRGVHCNDVPDGASKLVTCVRGSMLDVMVDLRVGSPTFGRYEVTRMSADDGVALYLPGSVGHAFLALEDGTCVNYLLSTEYVPGAMVDLDALDAELGLPWDLAGPPVRSAKDAAAPSLAEVLASGRLPHYSPPAPPPSPPRPRS
ncbi:MULTISPECIES: dTDP-4-dehydrorhamnose 3,5-epimerase family protein [unclassified Streptomyces]|uniref:dTDP-4-dehydrorhamnose 3,5-epimerase family protein n=1 Tax=unclassified Streptomyces TaxID=2593676 RepID=UPI00244151D7|nr:dTDP-4-dehydrorhamnose 3,5-epimerase [Streptomyces sp. DH41]MDG9723673.1 dTDP-4-dehydrorhamnose 3,5-epimerase [Streptomyces sp. DH41]